MTLQQDKDQRSGITLWRRLHHVSYMPLLALSMAIMMARLFVWAWLLEPKQFAILSAVLVASSLVLLAASFGMYLDLLRTLPVLLARRQTRMAAVRLCQASLGALVAASILALAGVFRVSVGEVTSSALLLGAFHGLSQQLFLVVTAESRSAKEPLRYAIQNLVRAVVSVTLSVVVAIWTDSAALILLTEAVVTFIVIAFIAAAARRRWNLSWARIMALSMRNLSSVDWTSAFALLAYSALATAAFQMDRWLSSVMLVSENFAHYSFAWTVTVIAMSVQALISASAYPTLAERFAISGPQPAFRMAAVLSFSLLVFGAAALAPALWIVDWIIPVAFPKYRDATSLFLPLGLAAMFRLSDFWSSYLIIAGRERAIFVAVFVVGGTALAAWSAMLLGDTNSAASFANLSVAVAGGVYAVTAIMAWSTMKRRSR